MKPMNKIKRKKMHGRIYLKYCSKITIFLQNKTHLYKIKLKKNSTKINYKKNFIHKRHAKPVV